jgi:hypothetical protein
MPSTQPTWFGLVLGYARAIENSDRPGSFGAGWDD